MKKLTIFDLETTMYVGNMNIHNYCYRFIKNLTVLMSMGRDISFLYKFCFFKNVKSTLDRANLSNYLFLYYIVSYMVQQMKVLLNK